MRKILRLLFGDYFLPVQLKVETAEKKSSTPVIQKSLVATAQEDSGSQPCSFACMVESPTVFKTPGDLTAPRIIKSEPLGVGTETSALKLFR